MLANKAITLAHTGKRDEAVRILGELALDPDSPLDVAEIAKATLAQLPK